MSQIEYTEERNRFLGLKDSFTRVFRHSFVYGLGSISIGLFSFLLIPLYTRFLTTKDYGIIFSVAALEAVLMTIFALQLDGAAFRFYFDETGQERKRLIGTIWLFQTAVSFVLSALLFGFAGQAAALIFRDINMQPYLKLLAIRIFLNIGGLIPLVIFQAKEKSLIYIFLTISTALLGISLNIYFITYLKRGALGMLQAGVITSAVFYLIYVFLIFKETILSLRLNIILKPLMFSLPIIPHSLAAWVLNLSDRILLQRLASAQELGLYALGCNLSLALGVVVIAINQAWTPFFYSVAKKNENSPIIAKLITYYFMFVCFLALAISIFSKEFTGLMAASNYRSAYRVIPVIVLSYVIQGMYFISANAMFFKKKTKYLPIATSIAAATNFVLNILWIPRYGMIGAAWATAIAFGVLYLITSFISNKIYIIGYERARITKIAISAIVIYAISLIIKTDSLITSICVKMLVLSGYVVVLFLLRFLSKEEINKIKSILYIKNENTFNHR